MRALIGFENIFICNVRVDFRKSIDGLSKIVESELELNLFARNLFVFFNKQKDKAKILYWDHSGFALWLKRLEKDKFQLKGAPKEAVVTLTPSQLDMLLSGIDVWKMRPHEALKITRVS